LKSQDFANDVSSFEQAADGSRQPTAKELELATEQGKAFYGAVSKVSFA
jgi:hypothetical protein